jgi:hypothetical protein
MMRRVLLLSLVLAAVAAVPAEAATRVNQFNPWSEDGDPLIPRYFHGDGECGRASAVSTRDDAWRCVSGNIALDPCFLSPTDEEVFCAKTPWSKIGHLLSVLIDPESHGTSPAPGPWAVRVGRRRCTYVAGPAKRKGPTYRCGTRGPFLFGAPNRRKKTWTIKQARTRKGQRMRVKIRAAWL